MQLPGIVLIHAMTSLAAIGEVTRFAHARQLVGYSLNAYLSPIPMEE